MNKYLIPICYLGVIISGLGEFFFDLDLDNTPWFFLITAGIYEIQEKIK